MFLLGNMQRKIAAALLITAVACSLSIPVQARELQATPAVTFVSHMQTKIQALRVRYSQSTGGETIHNPADLVHVYDRTGYTPIWSHADGWNNNAHRMLDYLAQLPQHGIDPNNYHLLALRRLTQQITLANRIHADLLLSDAFISLASDLRRGASSRYSDTAQGRHLLLRLRPSTDPAHEFDALLPKDKGYWALSNALKQRLRKDDHHDAIELSAYNLIKPGQRHPQVAKLRQRLQQLDMIASDAGISEPELFDPQLSQALSAFQQSHGLDADGMLGPSTRAALNRDIHDEIEMISLNLERWRQLAPEYADSHVRVNIAAQNLDYVYQGKKQLSMKVIAGRKSRPTPTTHSAIREVVFNPYWNVPPRIAAVDKLPKIRSNPDYLPQHGFSLWSSWHSDALELDPGNIDWSRVTRDNFNYFLRQDPGPDNALGQVKFLFPNDYSVYLHDTPNKGLFERGQRLFSSGCVRLDQPMALAELLLRNHSDTAKSQVVNAQAFAQNQSVHLNEQVPVYLEYWTAWIDDHGILQLRNDVYENDAPVLTALRESGAFRSAMQLAQAATSDSNLQLATADLH